MTDSYTHVAKPTGTTYTIVGFPGKQVYDDSTILYDSPSTFYDSTDDSAYTNIAKPTGGAMSSPGIATGLLMPPTYSYARSTGDDYTHISKPTT